MRKFKEEVTSPSFSVIRTFTSTGAIIKNRVVKLLATGNITHTTGSSGRGFLGIALARSTGAGGKVAVAMRGIVQVHVSTRAVAKGAYVRATSGAASTGSNLGGTVRTSTAALTTAAPVRHNIVGQALTSAAAAAAGTQRLIDVMILNIANNPALL